MNASNYCTCRPAKPQGYKKVGEDWVCSLCSMPTKQWRDVVQLPRILAGPRYPELKEHVQVFIQRMNARYWQEVNDVASQYLIPAGVVAQMMENSNIDGKYIER